MDINGLAPVRSENCVVAAQGTWDLMILMFLSVHGRFGQNLKTKN